MSQDSQSIFIVDDDAAVRDSLSLLLSLHGYQTRLFECAESFLSAYSHQFRGCLLLDLRMGSLNGLQLQSELSRRSATLPIIFVTGHGDVAAARTAFRGGAIDFIEKPIDDVQLLNAIQSALDYDIRHFELSTSRDRTHQALARLTARERQVVDLVIEGMQNREIASRLQISPRTVEVHKAHAMEKLQVDRLADLLRLFS